jgi:hypothetical protein
MMWLKGLLSAVIGGAANAGLTVLVAPDVFNFGNGLNQLGVVAAGGAIIAALGYLKQSPLPGK